MIRTAHKILIGVITTNSEYEIVLKSGAKISSSRRYRKIPDNLLKI